MKETLTTKQNDNLYFGGHLVAFIDMLGQSDKLAKLRETRWWEPEDSTKAILRDTYGKVHRLRTIFSGFISAFVTTSPLDEAFRFSLGGEELRKWDQFGQDRILHKGLSDSLILTFPLLSSKGLLPFKSVFGVFGACASSMLVTLNYGFAIRGAMEIGPCIFDKEAEEVYGTALSDAVRLEKDAHWPRILIGSHLVEYLEECVGLPQATMIDRLNVTCAELCLKTVLKDDDGHWYLNYLAPQFMDSETPRNSETLIKGAVTFIKQQLKDYEGEPDVRQKYERLRGYFTEHGVEGF